jgi:chaperone modulatory protein CbpM
MLTDSPILVRDFCVYHRIDVTFVYALERHGLIDFIVVEQNAYVQPDQLTRLEKFVRLYQDLAIVPDDLDVVANLLDQIENLQTQVAQLQSRLRFYE